jgi:hypothetical protein
VLPKLGRILLLLGVIGVVLAQGQTTQSDSFQIVNCATPCVAELALTQMPTGTPAISINGAAVNVALSRINTASGETIVVSFPASVKIQNTDVIVATYTVAAATPAAPAGPASPASPN